MAKPELLVGFSAVKLGRQTGGAKREGGAAQFDHGTHGTHSR